MIRIKKTGIENLKKCLNSIILIVTAFCIISCSKNSEILNEELDANGQTIKVSHYEKTFNVYYTGTEENIKKFVDRMRESGLQNQIRNMQGNICYDYYISTDDKRIVLLVDKWETQEDADAYHSSEIMKEVNQIKDEYQIESRPELFIEIKMSDFRQNQ